MKLRSLIPGLLLLSFASVGTAATTQTWDMSGYTDFARGRLNGLSLSRDGKLLLGPRVETLFDSSQSSIWSVAQAPDGSLYLGTGNRGRLYRVDANGNGILVWTADQPMIFALAVDSNGVVYAATSPQGKIYRIQNGQASEYFSPGTRYIWALAMAADGSLYAATGDDGKIYRITAARQGSVFYETGQANVTALAFDQAGHLLAGSEPNGILYRFDQNGKAFVLYDANLPEIRAILPDKNGSLYVAALGGGSGRRANSPTAAASMAAATAVPTVSTSITVMDQQGGLNAIPKPETPKASSSQSSPITTLSTGEITGVEKSALYRINSDNTIDTLWSSKEENIYDVALDGSSVVFLTDGQSRIYRMDGDRKPTLLSQDNDGDAIRLINTPRGLLAAMGSPGKILKLTGASQSAAWFESPVHDSNTVARWGRISWRGSGSGIQFRTRSGNSARPDPTWSNWSDPISNADQASITSPNARYIQWRAEFTSPSASLDSVSIALLPQNGPPVIRSITASAQQKPAASSNTSSSASAAFSITVSDAGDTSAAAGTPTQTISRGAGQQIQISWQADDPDGDKLLYNLYFRGEEENQWKLLRANMTDNTFALDGDVLADGRYFFRVTASDRLSNATQYAREAEFVSTPVEIDNTPPTVNVAAPVRSGSAVVISVDSEDRGSALRRFEYSLDAGPWTPVEASDGVTDSAKEHFEIRFNNLTGEHLLVVRAWDATGNAGLAKVVVR